MPLDVQKISLCYMNAQENLRKKVVEMQVLQHVSRCIEFCLPIHGKTEIVQKWIMLTI